MLFYVTLLLISILLTLIILGLKNLIMFVFKKAVQGGREGVKYRTASKSYVRVPGSTGNEVSSAWGKRDYATSGVPAKTHPASAFSATPWGWPGGENGGSGNRSRSASTSQGSLNAYLARSYNNRAPVADWKRNIGRPIRDDWSPLTGEVYKPSKDAMSKYEMNE